ncbi:hypothetical protein EDD17DRAFT_1786436 [Pisolithus thermaeus]|nr:hypothetical protein EDD17DRAFT_1786436 [Pisolithus thermaeus]
MYLDVAVRKGQFVLPAVLARSKFTPYHRPHGASSIELRFTEKSLDRHPCNDITLEDARKGKVLLMRGLKAMSKNTFRKALVMKEADRESARLHALMTAWELEAISRQREFLLAVQEENIQQFLQSADDLQFFTNILEQRSLNTLKNEEDFQVGAYGQDLTLLALEDERLSQMEEVSSERVEREAVDSQDDLSAILAAAVNVDALETDGSETSEDELSFTKAIMRAQSKGKRPRKTKPKYPESSGYNPSGNSAATQIGITEEQPLPVAEIEWQLQTEAHTHHYSSIDNDQEDWMPSTSGHEPQFAQSVPVSEHPYERFFLGSQTHMESGPCPETFSLQSSLAHPSILPDLDHTSSAFPESQTHVEFSPIGYTNLPQSEIFNPASSFAYPIQEAQHGGSSLLPYPYVPLELDYAPPTLATGFLRQPVSHIAPYSVRSQHPEAIERPLRPGETMPNEAFTISRRSVIQQQVGQTTQSITQDPPTSRLLPNMLPTTDELKVMIRQALHDAAVNYDKVGVKDWLAKNTESEVKKLKDITTNIRNNFKSVARILALPLYDLVVPIQCRDQEAALRRQRVPVLCLDFTWLDGDFMDELGMTQVPFGHMALMQIVLNLLWGKKQYWCYLPVGNTDLTRVIVFTGTILHQVLDEYAGGTFSAQEFNVRMSGTLYKTLYTCAVSLEGCALASYIKLMEDLHAQGAEMLGGHV